MVIILGNDKKTLVRLNTLSLEKNDHQKPLLEFYAKTGKRLWCIIPSPYEVFLQVTTVDRYDTESGRTYYRFSISNPVICLSSEQSSQLVSFGSCDIYEVSDLFEINKDFSISRRTVEDVDLLMNPVDEIIKNSQIYENHNANPFVRNHRRVRKFVCGFSKKIGAENFGEKDLKSGNAPFTLEHVLIDRNDFEDYLSEYHKIFPDTNSILTEEWMPFGIILVNRINDQYREDLINNRIRGRASKKKKIEEYVFQYSGNQFANQKIGDVLRIVEETVTFESEGFYKLYNESPLRLLDLVNCLARFDIEAQAVTQVGIQKYIYSSDSSRDSNSEIDQSYSKDPEIEISETFKNKELVKAVNNKMDSVLFRKRSKNGTCHRKWIQEELHILGYENVRRLSQTISELIRMKELK